MSHIQERMKKLGVKQVDLILELRKRGITVQPPEMSSIDYETAARILWFPPGKSGGFSIGGRSSPGGGGAGGALAGFWFSLYNV